MTDGRDNSDAGLDTAGAARADAVAHWSLSPRGVTWLGMGANAILASAKMAAGAVFASQTILADGLHSASDLTTDFMVLLSVGVSGRPPDVCHPYGHRRIGTMLAMGVAAVLGAAAAWIFYVSLTALGQPGRPSVGLFGQALSAKHGVWAMALLYCSVVVA